MADQTKAQRRESREERLRAALRENLRRRKAQARGRGSVAEKTATSPGESGNVEPEKGES